MYRYKDQQGRTQELADEYELRAAIADGRIHGATPFASGDERWTIASRHPAFQQLQQGGASATKSAGASAAGWQRYALAALPLVMFAAVAYGKVDRRLDERDRMVEALATLNKTGNVSPAILESPPRGRAAKQVWVYLAASHDVHQTMLDARHRFGVDNEPADFLEPHYIVRPTAYPQVKEYFNTLERFYITYTDSLGGISERTMTARAAEAKLSDADLERMVRDASGASETFANAMRANVAWAVQARRVHDVLVSAQASGVSVSGERVMFTEPVAQRMFDAAVRRLADIETRVDSLQQDLARRAQADVEKAMRR